MKKIALWMTYLYFFICPLEFIFNRYFGSSVKYIAIVAAACMLMFFIGNRQQTMRFGAIQVCIVAWAVLEAASFLWTIRVGLTLSILTTYIMMAILVFAISLFPFDKKEFEGVLLSYMLGCVVLGAMVLIMGDLDSGYSNFGRITINILGSYQDPNSLAASLLSGAFFALHQMLKKPKGFPIFNILYGAAFVVMTLATFLTASRGALIAYVGALFIYLFMRSSQKSRAQMVAISLVSIVLLYFVLYLTLSKTAFNRLFDFSGYIGGGGRLRIWKPALREIIIHPLFGRGVASYLGYFMQVLNEEVAMHNSFLALVFECGIVGLTLFMIPFIQSMYAARYKKNAMIIAIISANLIAAFFLDALVVRYLWNAMMFGIIFYNVSLKEQNEAQNIIDKA